MNEIKITFKCKVIEPDVYIKKYYCNSSFTEQ